MKHRFFVIILVATLLSCTHADLTSQPPFSPSVGIPEFQDWCRKALNQPNANSAYHQFSLAYHGDAQAIRAYFSEALKQCESSEIDAEEGEFLQWTMETLLQRLGDERFADILSTESPRSQSAVGNFLSDRLVTKYLHTNQLLTAAPHIDFPLNKAYRG